MKSFEWGRDMSFGSGQIIMVHSVDLAKAFLNLGMCAPADDHAVRALSVTPPARAGRSTAGAWY